uniref:Uncharacterized protein n=1 Tax=Chromera velia CCMP2878 TaxID=1169474 RepID=A0A0G4FAK9_9ALVE|eukprot:Cvel_15903.t1-p1 / transcript=Cvel_15903.t1 / gene=Cvel_15903 / organism=Chromera_velia_CCMP2878 / gene_product=hypothetical protein / transcript_product=hypothetical protein / location=Cvel_scaffold1202:6964-13088(+) / protein_length=277 / sequence_SO=supercontig / SO=protein_coding / is_pseudo=false
MGTGASTRSASGKEVRYGLSSHRDEEYATANTQWKVPVAIFAEREAHLQKRVEVAEQEAQRLAVQAGCLQNQLREEESAKASLQAEHSVQLTEIQGRLECVQTELQERDTWVQQLREDVTVLSRNRLGLNRKRLRQPCEECERLKKLTSLRHTFERSQATLEASVADLLSELRGIKQEQATLADRANRAERERDDSRKRVEDLQRALENAHSDFARLSASLDAERHPAPTSQAPSNSLEQKAAVMENPQKHTAPAAAGPLAAKLDLGDCLLGAGEYD